MYTLDLGDFLLCGGILLSVLGGIWVYKDSCTFFGKLLFYIGLTSMFFLTTVYKDDWFGLGSLADEKWGIRVEWGDRSNKNRGHVLGSELRDFDGIGSDIRVVSSSEAISKVTDGDNYSDGLVVGYYYMSGKWCMIEVGFMMCGEEPMVSYILEGSGKKREVRSMLHYALERTGYKYCTVDMFEGYGRIYFDRLPGHDFGD